MTTPAELQPLQHIRDTGPISSRNTSKGALTEEAYQVFKAVSFDTFQSDTIRQLILAENVIHKTSFSTRLKIWDALKHRYLTIASQWVGQSLAVATLSGSQSAEYLSLAYLYYALRDRVTYEFITGPTWIKWQQGITSIDRTDYMLFLDRMAETEIHTRNWRETTRVRLGRSTLAALRDFGLLRGQVIKHIQRPPIAPETVFHLLCILFAEGKAGRAIVEAVDWRLFLWTEAEVSNALNDLAQKRWINFERGGQTVIISLVRYPDLTGSSTTNAGETDD